MSDRFLLREDGGLISDICCTAIPACPVHMYFVRQTVCLPFPLSLPFPAPISIGHCRPLVRSFTIRSMNDVDCLGTPPSCCPTSPSMVHGVLHHYFVQALNGLHIFTFSNMYRAPGKSMYLLLSRTQAGPGRTVKQEQEEISRNHVQTFSGCSVRRREDHLFTNGAPP